ncbi:MAG: nucleotidyltransferase family protein [Acidobacteriota bacterium]
MKAFILAAGLGTRLRPLTDSVPKCLLPVRGKPILQYWLELCANHGISQVLINLHHHDQKVREFVRSRDWGLTVVLTFEPTLLGSGGTVRSNGDWIRQESEFAILYADNLTNVNLTRMREFHQNSGRPLTMGLFRTSFPEQCGIVRLSDYGVVVEFAEKPASPWSNLANAGIYFASPAILNLIPAHTPCDIGHDLLPLLVGNMMGYCVPEYLLDIGTPESYAQAQQDADTLTIEDC